MRVGCLGIEAKPFTRTHMHQFTEYLRQFGHFQRNARLFLLIYAPIGIATGVGIVLYPLYLSALGYRTDFIGLQISVGTLSAGLALVPAGFCVDHFGGKAMLFWSGVLLAVGSGIHVLFRDPVLILVGASVLGIGGATLLVLYSRQSHERLRRIVKASRSQQIIKFHENQYKTKEALYAYRF
jgi:hypothetical protein